MTRILIALGMKLDGQDEYDLLSQLVQELSKDFAGMFEALMRLRSIYPRLMENNMFRAMLEAAQDGRNNGVELSEYIRLATAEQWEQKERP